MGLESEKYVAFTTFKKDGTPKPTAVWIVAIGDGTLGFTTEVDSWKVKRLANNSQVLLQPSDGRGNVKEGSVVTEATATVDPARFAEVQALVKAKYGVAFRLIGVVSKIRKLRNPDIESTAVIITPAD